MFVKRGDSEKILDIVADNKEDLDEKLTKAIKSSEEDKKNANKKELSIEKTN